MHSEINQLSNPIQTEKSKKQKDQLKRSHIQYVDQQEFTNLMHLKMKIMVQKFGKQLETEIENASNLPVSHHNYHWRFYHLMSKHLSRSINKQTNSEKEKEIHAELIQFKQYFKIVGHRSIKHVILNQFLIFSYWLRSQMIIPMQILYVQLIKYKKLYRRNQNSQTNKRNLKGIVQYCKLINKIMDFDLSSWWYSDFRDKISPELIKQNLAVLINLHKKSNCSQKLEGAINECTKRLLHIFGEKEVQIIQRQRIKQQRKQAIIVFVKEICQRKYLEHDQLSFLNGNNYKRRKNSLCQCSMDQNCGFCQQKQQTLKS